MPLKKKNVKIKSVTVEEGNPLQDEELMSLFSGQRAKLPLLTLNVEQFAWPESFVVRYVKRVEEKETDFKTGWNKKDSSGNYITTGKFNVQLRLADGTAAQTLLDAGQDIQSLPVISCLVKADVPLEKFEEDSTLVKLVKPVVMLGLSVEGKQGKWDHIKLVCEDLEFV